MYMKLALALSRKADPFPNPRVGAVLVKEARPEEGRLEAEVLGIGFHKAPGMPHAEIEAIKDAKRRSGNPLCCRGSTLYVTLEPCSHTMKRTPPCTKAIIDEGIERVVFAMKDPNPLVGGADALRKAGIRVDGPTDELEARKINKRYLENIRKKPFVALKMAMSADGKSATRTGDSRWISSKESRDLVHQMRSDFDAVMVGAGTVIKDDPRLTTRNPKLKNPYRIIIDGKLAIPMDSGVMKNPDGKTIIATSAKAKKRIKAFERSKVMILVCGHERVDLKKLILALSAMGIKKILIEGGSRLAGEAIEEGIVDKLYLFIAPKIIGGESAKPVIGGLGIARMSDAIDLRRMKIRKIGADYLLEADIIKKP